MIRLIDTHTHLYLPQFDDDRDEAVARAQDAGVVKLLMPSIDTESTGRMLDAVRRYPGICHAMTGLHPTSVKHDYEQQLEKLMDFDSEDGYCAIGEIGIDMYWDKTFLREQTAAFRKQVVVALERDLPVVIHSRESFTEIVRVLEEFRGSRLKGVFHAFSGTIEDAWKVIMMGFKIGVGGPVTFRNSGLAGVVEAVGAEHLILETDSPYLAPVPHRGKRNESSYICIVNRKVAELLKRSEEEVAEITCSNAAVLFKL